MKVNKLVEVRLNTHQQHLESLPVFGQSGLDELNNYIEKLLKQLTTGTKELTLMSKIDGAPSVIMWHKIGNGYPDNSIALKSFVNGPSTAMSSAEEIDKKYSDRPDMAEKLKQCLKLAKYIPTGEAWQGDCLFTKNDLKEETINGVTYVTFHPNKIVYAFSEDNPGYNSIKNADFGIAFHTIYTLNNGAISQSFEVDNSRINAPDNFYLLFHEMGTQNKENDFNVDKLVKDFSELKQIENKLINDTNYENLVNNKQFISYWNTFENREFADNKKTNINPNTILKDLKDYILNKKEQEFNKKQSTLKTDQGKAKAKEKYDSELLELEDLLNNNKDTIINMVNAINKAADVKMDLWRSLNKTKDEYSSFYKSKSKGFIPANREGISMSDADGNLVKIVDRSEFSSNNRNPDFESGFAHESLKEEIERDLTKEEISNLFKKLNKSHFGAGGNCGNLALAVAREIPNKDKKIIICSDWTNDLEELENYIDWDLSIYHVALMVDGNIFDFTGTINIDYLENLCKIEYDDGDPQIISWGYSKEDDDSFRRVFEWGTNYDVYPEYYQKLIKKLNNEKEESFGVATQGANMGSFKSFTKNINEDSNKVAVVAVGRMNPPTIGHKALVNALSKIGSKYGVKPKLFLTHSSNNVKNPLSYESKLRWAAKAFGDDVEIVNSNARNIIEFLSELYNEGYTKIVYAGDKERIGGVEDVSNNILKYNGKPDKSGKLLYDFDEIVFENTGDREVPYEGAQNASATHVRKLAAEKNFDEFKKYVPFNENDAKNLFNELRHALKDFTNIVEKYLTEIKLTKKNYTPEVKKELDRELDKIDKRLDAPDPNMDATAYRQNIDKYTGLFTKQGANPDVVYSEDDIKKLYPEDYDKILKELDNLSIKDDAGRDVNLTKTGTNVITKSGGGLDSTTTTLLQEAISGLILGNRISNPDIKELLQKSDPIKKTGIFKLLNFDKNITQEDWNDFIKKWGNSFNVEQANKSDFISVANSILDGNVENADIIHDALKNKYSTIARSILTGADQFDKSDVYYCTGNTEKILKTMENFRKNNDIVGYVDFMVNNSDKIIGVSLKQVGKNMRVVWDIPPKKTSDFSNVVYWPKTEAKSQALVFEDKDGHEKYILAIRSNSNTPGSTGAVEWREDGGKAMMGKGASKLENNFGAEFTEEFNNARRTHDFAKATKLLLEEIAGTGVKPGNAYEMTKEGKKKLVNFFNDSCGFNSTNDQGQRVSAPYIKVY